MGIPFQRVANLIFNFNEFTKKEKNWNRIHTSIGQNERHTTAHLDVSQEEVTIIPILSPAIIFAPFEAGAIISNGATADT